MRAASRVESSLETSGQAAAVIFSARRSGTHRTEEHTELKPQASRAQRPQGLNDVEPLSLKSATVYTVVLPRLALVGEMGPLGEPVSLSWLERACLRAFLVAFEACVLPVLEQLQSHARRTLAR